MIDLFADTVYWVALINPHDQLHELARAASAELADARIFTSDWVLTELLNRFAERGPRLRFVVSTAVGLLRANPNVIVVSQTPESFEKAFDLYCERTDKGWSLTDCSSFIIMRRHGIDKALTHDKHFEQAGFTALMR